MTQKLKYKIIVAQDIVGVKCNQTIYAIKHQTIYALKQYIAELKRIVFLQKISGRAKEVIAGTLKKNSQRIRMELTKIVKGGLKIVCGEV